MSDKIKSVSGAALDLGSSAAMLGEQAMIVFYAAGSSEAMAARHASYVVERFQKAEAHYRDFCAAVLQKAIEAVTLRTAGTEVELGIAA